MNSFIQHSGERPAIRGGFQAGDGGGAGCFRGGGRRRNPVTQRMSRLLEIVRYTFDRLHFVLGDDLQPY